MSKKQIQNERVEKNLKVLKLGLNYRNGAKAN